MNFLSILLLAVAAIGLLCLLTAYICFRMAFFTPRKPETEEFPLPKGEIYDPYRDILIGWMKEVRAMPC